MALLNLAHLKSKYSLKVEKIVHVGAHEGQEVEEYLENFSNAEINLFEPQPNLFAILKSKYEKRKNINLYDFALGSEAGSSTMYSASNGGLSSSFYKPKEHLIEHPEIKFELQDNIFQIKTLNQLNILNIDFLNIDTQGYEMEVLKGSTSALENDIKYIILEVNKRELYEGCPLVYDIDKFLKTYNFIRTDTHFWLDSYSWGDAFYIKKEFISLFRVYFSIIKNTLYKNQLAYKKLIYIRNLIWKNRKK